MWETLRKLTLGEGGQKPPTQEKGDVLTSEHSFEPEYIDKSPTCHFLRLPVEIRMQIYSYTDIGGHTIEVLNLPITQTPQGAQCYRTYSDDPVEHKLLYRLEEPNDDPHARVPCVKGPIAESSGYANFALSLLPIGRSNASSSAGPVKKIRCFSVHGLFSLTSVCRQIRADTQVLVYELNAFAFTDKNYNYSSAIRAFLQPLTARETAAIHSICWPLVNVWLYRRSLHGAKLEEADRKCAKELRALKGLETVVLRHYGDDFSSSQAKHSEAEKKELTALFAEHGGWDYAVQRQFQRTLAVRAMNILLVRADVDVQCERSWRASF